jgi:hydrogenase nickel incorporation protein HypA/HybF
MHEQSLINDLIRKIEAIARQQQAERVIGVRVRLGALAHLSPEHFRAHYVAAARGTLAEGAALEIQVMSDITDPHAQDLLLDSVEVEA